MSIIPPITPEMLHKHKEDDVLLSHPRKVLPARFLSAETHTASDPNLVMLNSLYEVTANNEYVLRIKSLSPEAQGMSYNEVVTQTKNDKIRAVPHQVIDTIKAGLPQDAVNDLSVSDEQIDAFLEHHKVGRHSSSFQFVNQADHYFFYSKPHEHVPGIMLLEAARQTIYYQLYSYSEQKLGKVTVSLSELNAKFYNYAELMYPIEIVVDDLSEGDTLKPKEVLYSVSFYQKGMLIARIDSLAPVISLKRFKLARNARLFSDEERFTPLVVAPITAFISCSDGQKYLVVLNDIGITQCSTSRAPLNGCSTAYFSVVYDNKLHFQSAVSLQSEADDHLRWSFVDVDYKQLETLKEIIKRGFVGHEQHPQRV